MKDKPKPVETEKTRSFLSALSPKERAQLRAHFKMEGSDAEPADAAKDAEKGES